MNDTVIKIEHISKHYRLGTIGGGTLRGDLQSWWARVRKKEDPNLKIGETAHGKNETFLALDDISFEVKKGDTVGLIGGNGAGKSTTLKLLSRVTAPTSGEIYINGRIASMLEVGTGFHPELTGRENIYLNGAILGMKRREVDKKIDEIIQFSECEKFIDTPVKRYSSGMFVKLAFSVAAHLDNEIMIMDEVLAVGDMSFQKKCIDKMLSVARSGKTIIYVSHNMNTIRRLCSRGIVLKKGKLIYDGSVDEAISLYLNNAKMQKRSIYDFTSSKRPNFFTDKIFFERLEIIGNNGCVFKNGEKIHMRIRFRANENIPSLSLRMMIHNAEQEPVATSVCPDFISCKKGMTYEKDFVMDIEPLCSGEYKVLMAAYESDEFGNVFDADAVWPALVFDCDKISALDWKPSLFGNIELKNTEVVD